MARTIATTTTVSLHELVDWLRTRHHAVLITTKTNGAPQASPVTIGLDDSGRLVISSYPGRAKSLNLRRNPSVSVCVLSDDFRGAWVQIDGRGEVLDMPEALDPLVEYYRNIAGEHPDWDEYRQAMVDQDKVLLRIEIDHWGPIATGDFPARLAGG